MEIRKDFKCTLRDVNTGRDLLTFAAQQVSDPNFSADFVGGNVSSGSQFFSILVDKAYYMDKRLVENLENELNPLEQEVIIDNHKWILTNYTQVVRRKLGAGWATKRKKLYLLNLE